MIERWFNHRSRRIAHLIPLSYFVNFETAHFMFEGNKGKIYSIKTCRTPPQKIHNHGVLPTMKIISPKQPVQKGMLRWLVYSGDEETPSWNEVNRPSGGGVMNDCVTGRRVAMVHLAFCADEGSTIYARPRGLLRCLRLRGLLRSLPRKCM
jgi:hypothetical protein